MESWMGSRYLAESMMGLNLGAGWNQAERVKNKAEHLTKLKRVSLVEIFLIKWRLHRNVLRVKNKHISKQNLKRRAYVYCLFRARSIERKNSEPIFPSVQGRGGGGVRVFYAHCVQNCCADIHPPPPHPPLLLQVLSRPGRAIEMKSLVLIRRV
jgi:hypothetical protein